MIFFSVFATAPRQALAEVSREKPASLAGAVTWLRNRSTEMIHGCRRTTKSGVAAFPPQVGGGYEAFWLRDYAYMIEGNIDAFSDKELKDAYRFFLAGQRADGAMVDCIKFDGTPCYMPGYGTMGRNPVADGSQFMVDIAWRTFQKTRDTNLISESLDALIKGMNAVPRDPATGLVFIKPGAEHDRCPYGFTDAIRKQGDELFCSLLVVQASRQLGDLLDAAHRNAEAAQWRQEEQRITSQIRQIFWDGKTGLFRAATVVCNQPDIWGSAFAVYLNASTPDQTEAIANYFKAHYSEIVKRGQLRHLPGNTYWEQTIIGVRPGTYQNGAFWATPVGWFVNALDFADPFLADRTAVDLVGDFIDTGDENECVNDWFNGVSHYLASVALPLDGIAAMQERRAARKKLPGFEALARGPQQVRLFSGQTNFVFSMYGVPGDLAALRQLVEVMRERRLGNGFDPGPSPQPGSKPIFDYLARVGWPVMCYPGGDMQVKGGRGALGATNRTVLTAMDDAGVFTAVQLGEWGYYFHNLSMNERWWRDNFGADFDAFKHLMKPAGLAGYERQPSGKQECYDVLKDYFTSRSRDLLDRVISVTGHSHYEAYAAEWGARCVGLEVGENIAFTQSKLAFARGASRQWDRPWSVQVSPWLSGGCTTSGPLSGEGGNARGLDAGHSLSFYERMWLHGWFAGAAMVTPENSLAIFFEKPEDPWVLTSHGRKAAEVFAFISGHDRGIPYAPVAIVLDHLAGYNGYMDKPWGILKPTAGDREVRDLFDFQLFPGSDHIHSTPFPENPELSYLRPTPYGEMFDVLLTGASAKVLSSYPVILLAGDIRFDKPFVGVLEECLRHGSRVMISAAHRAALGGQFDRLAGIGNVEVLEDWTNPVTRRAAAVSNARLAALREECLPVKVTGDPIEYQINRTPSGWMIELINNQGVVKFRDKPAVVDPTAVARVRLEPKMACRRAVEMRANRVHENSRVLDVVLGPGGTEFVEFYGDF